MIARGWAVSASEDQMQEAEALLAVLCILQEWEKQELGE